MQKFIIIPILIIAFHSIIFGQDDDKTVDTDVRERKADITKKLTDKYNNMCQQYKKYLISDFEKRLKEATEYNRVEDIELYTAKLEWLKSPDSDDWIEVKINQLTSRHFANLKTAKPGEKDAKGQPKNKSKVSEPGVIPLENFAPVRVSKTEKRGLNVEFFNRDNFKGIPFFKMSVDNIDFSWKNKLPNGRSTRDPFCARFKGYIIVDKDGHYEIRAKVQEATYKVFFKNREILSSTGSADATYKTYLKKGLFYKIQVDFTKTDVDLRNPSFKIFMKENSPTNEKAN